MKNFLNVHDVEDIHALVDGALLCKQNPRADHELGKGKTLGLIFMNPSLRTRLSTQKAGRNLGMDVMVMNFSGEGWALETEEGVIMNGDKAEHIKEAAAVIGAYCDIIGLRSFPSLKDRKSDYTDHVINEFVRYAGVPIVNLESATVHPCQSLADVLTIEETKEAGKPKVVLTWVPHPRPLPQSVGNSFAEWINRAGYEFVIANPEGYDLSGDFTGNAAVVHEPEEAYAGADYIYAKNWSSYEQYGQVLSQDEKWMVDERKMNLTNNAKFMHCLPVRRNVVVSDAVIDSENSVVIREAANREFAAQAVLKQILSHG
ncbi:MAG: N-acetylornithine carbamoyltransferase [Cytophagales bacterium]|nr:N-acetylornithine carbamoyltransferase [Cytophagales bacterium]